MACATDDNAIERTADSNSSRLSKWRYAAFGTTPAPRCFAQNDRIGAAVARQFHARIDQCATQVAMFVRVVNEMTFAIVTSI